MVLIGYNIKVVNCCFGMLPNREKRKRDLLEALYETRCISKAGAKLGLKRAEAFYWCKALNIDTRSVVRDRQRELVESAIAGGCQNKTQIADETGLTPQTVESFFVEIGFEPIRAAHQLIGQKFGDWTVESVVSSGRVACVCSCGARSEAQVRNLREGLSQGCHQCGVQRRRRAVPIVGQTTGRKFRSFYAAGKALKVSVPSVVYAVKMRRQLDGELWDAQ